MHQAVKTIFDQLFNDVYSQKAAEGQHFQASGDQDGYYDSSGNWVAATAGAGDQGGYYDASGTWISTSGTQDASMYYPEGGGFEEIQVFQ